ncbi:ankyrin repeat domain-containing protein [Candidatus Mesenet endosymbiont of Agriotes lineatus]|uniref:ankyrin repeat domain-containing protein n=1 Tax=Candidatus Mesenet endosymbiont of Agriotes lineatus TaxID=3077948 RepID=UPI0030D185D4
MPINKKLLDAIELGNEEDVKYYVNNEDGTCGSCDYYYDEDYNCDAHCIDVNIQDDEHDNWSLLHYAIFHNKPSIVRLLLNLGANLEIQAKKGMRPLHLAVFYNRVEIAKILLDEKADVNVVGNLGNTPLGIARKKYSNNENYKNITELLEGVDHNRTIISSVEDMITSNTKDGIVDLRGSETTIIPNITTVIPQYLYQGSKNTTSLLLLGGNAENGTFSQASSLSSVNGLLMFIGYICAYAYRKMFSNPSTVVDTSSHDQFRSFSNKY